MKRRIIFLVLMCVGVFSQSALAVVPGLWKQTTEASFAKSKMKSAVVDSHGDVTLGRKIDILLATGKAPAVVSAVLADGKTVYAASGADGAVYRIADGKVKKFATLPATLVTCMVKQGKDLLVGGGGKSAGLYRIDPKGKVSKIFSDKDVKYVWATLPGVGGELFLATGPSGKVFRIDPAGKAQVIYHADKIAKNILCLAAGPEGTIFAGTDEKGLVLQIDPRKRKGRVIWDAAEKEISALVPDGAGGVYAATGDISKAAGTAPTGGKDGKPDKAKPATAPAKPATKSEKPAAPKADSASPEDEDKKKVVTVTLPQGKKLPTVTREGKKYYLLPNRKTGKVLAVPTERVRIRYKGDSDKKPDAKKKEAKDKAAPSRTSTPKADAKGNAVYHIDAAGMVRTIFRRPVVIHAMIARGDRLILATGNEGKIYYVTTDGTLVGQLVDTDAKQVTTLAAVAKDGTLLFATSNKGSVGRIGKKYAATGTLISSEMDAGQIAQWGTLKLTGAVPDGAKLTIATRSGNIKPAADNTWSSWSKEMPLADGFLQIGSPAARFLQYRVTMTSDGSITPTLNTVRTIYQVGNIAPAVSAVVVTVGKKGSGKEAATTLCYRHVVIKASDLNKDKLKFTVQYRPVGTDAWVQITDDLATPKFVWDTRTVADGRYELRVTASDSPSNVESAALTASRISEPIVVDNQPPRFKELGVKVRGKKAALRGLAVDATSQIVSMAYSVDSATKWKKFLPSDGICDSATERFSFETDDLRPGPHRITVRVMDLYGNMGYSGLNVTVGK